MIESDEGFSVEVLGGGHLGIVYREPGRAIVVLSEPAVEPVGYIIFRNSIKEWWPPGKWPPIEAIVQQKIVDNLRRAFRVQGYSIDVNETRDFRSELLRRLQKLEEHE